MSALAPADRRYTRRVIVATVVTVALVLGTVGTTVGVGVSAWRRRTCRVKSTEAHVNLDRIIRGARAYFEADHPDPEGTLLPSCFPSNAGAPLVTHADMSRGCCPGPCPADDLWEADGPNGQGWQALSFALSDPHHYKYRFAGGCCRGADCSTAGFTVQAIGDLDCNGVTALFERTGRVVDGEVVVSPPNYDPARELE
jgi:hypothetical protein